MPCLSKQCTQYCLMGSDIQNNLQCQWLVWVILPLSSHWDKQLHMCIYIQACDTICVLISVVFVNQQQSVKVCPWAFTDTSMEMYTVWWLATSMISCTEKGYGIVIPSILHLFTVLLPLLLRSLFLLDVKQKNYWTCVDACWHTVHGIISAIQCDRLDQFSAFRLDSILKFVHIYNIAAE